MAETTTLKDELIATAFDLSASAVKLHKYLKEENLAPLLAKNMLENGVAIGDAFNETNEWFFAMAAEKALKRTKATLYWAKLLDEGEYLPHDKFPDFVAELEAQLPAFEKASNKFDLDYF